VFVDAARVCETKEPIHITFFIYSEWKPNINSYTLTYNAWILAQSKLE
jgi:hypothetical protein